MSIKIIGAVLIIAACGGAGWSIAHEQRREEASLGQLVHALDYMGNELQMHLSPLPILCRTAQNRCEGEMKRVFSALSDALEKQTASNATECMDYVLEKNPRLTVHTQNALKQLGYTLGKFDVIGQQQGLESVKKYCITIMNTLGKDRETRLRSYQTLGLCAGIAIAILFI